MGGCGTRTADPAVVVQHHHQDGGRVGEKGAGEGRLVDVGAETNEMQHATNKKSDW